MKEQVISDPIWREMQEIMLYSEFVKPVKTCTLWLPRRCRLSGKPLFRKTAIKLRRHIAATPWYSAEIKEIHWVCPKEYTLLLLKGISPYRWVDES